MQKEIIIIGAGGFAVELYYYIQSIIAAGASLSFRGFSAIGKTILAEYGLSPLYLGDYDKIDLPKSAELAIGIGTAAVRKKIFDEFKMRGYVFANIVHPWTTINHDALNKSEGNIFMQGSGGLFLKIGNGNLFNGGWASHECEMGNFNVISNAAILLGRSKIGDFNSLGHGAVLLPNAKIGSNNKITPLSVVYKGCRDGCIMHGNPAENLGTVA